KEQRHPWSIIKSQELDCPLLRIWDSKCGSRPEADGRMPEASVTSRSPNQPLHTDQVRRSCFTTHLDHRIWASTPYISFKNPPKAIEELTIQRSGRPKRGAQYLTAIDPATRLMNGLPMLNVTAEMKHYSIQDPYQRRNEYDLHSYICLWEVGKEEVVGH
ncbi:hypothetical protein EK21DRAFT_67060, partial [Setomelanomma holmii]